MDTVFGIDMSDRVSAIQCFTERIPTPSEYSG
jgi:hypothetical protein